MKELSKPTGSATVTGFPTSPDRAGDAKDARYHEEMAKLYAQHVLKEQPMLQIQGLGGPKKKRELQEVLHKPVV